MRNERTRIRTRTPRRRRGVAVVTAVLAAAALVSAPAPASAATGSAGSHAHCRSNLAEHLRWTGRATQLVTVWAPRYRTTYARLTTWAKRGGCWVLVAGPFTARVGWNGLSNHHMEGDGTTPTGAYGIGSTMYGVAPDPGVHFRYHRLVCGDWWDENPRSSGYNSFVHVRCGVRPSFAKGSEALWKETRAYRSFAVIDYNMHPVVPGRGSGVFLHDDVGGPTAGCVSLSPSALLRVLRWLRPGSHPLIVIGTAGAIRRF